MDAALRVGGLIFNLLVVCTVLYFLIAFRKPLSTLLPRVKRAGYDGKRLLVEMEADSPQTSDTQSFEIPPGAHFDRPANMYWLGSDLRSVWAALAGGEPKSVLARNLRQSAHHANELGLLDSKPGRDLVRLRDRLLECDEDALGDDFRRELADETNAILGDFGNLVNQAQPDARLWP